MKKVVQVLVLAMMLAAGAYAQVTTSGSDYSMKMSGEQSSEGVFFDPLGLTMGNSFVLSGRSNNYSSTVLSVEFNYEQSGDPSCNSISGGSWNLALYTAEGGYRGSIYGKVVEGEITWDPESGKRDTTALLLVTGSTHNLDMEVEPDTKVSFHATTNLGDSMTRALFGGLPL